MPAQAVHYPFHGLPPAASLRSSPGAPDFDSVVF